jgi:hypothetical protein
MAETPTSPNPPPEDMHWGISYLREDIQDLRQGVRALHDRVDRIAETSAQRIDRVEQSLTTRIAVVAETLTKRVDSRFRSAPDDDGRNERPRRRHDHRLSPIPAARPLTRQ